MKKGKTSDIKFSKSINKGKKLIISSLLGCAVGILSMILLMLALSGVCTSLDDPHGIVAPLCFICIYLSAFCGGFAAVKKNGSCDALVCGSLCGTIFMLVIWMLFTAVGISMSVTESHSLTFLWKLLCIPSSILGSFFGLGSRNSKKRSKF